MYVCIQIKFEFEFKKNMNVLGALNLSSYLSDM